jgi:hypothetical protein
MFEFATKNAVEINFRPHFSIHLDTRHSVSTSKIYINGAQNPHRLAVVSCPEIVTVPLEIPPLKVPPL